MEWHDMDIEVQEKNADSRKYTDNEGRLHIAKAVDLGFFQLIVSVLITDHDATGVVKTSGGKDAELTDDVDDTTGCNDICPI